MGSDTHLTWSHEGEPSSTQGPEHPCVREERGEQHHDWHALAESERRYRRIVETAEEGVWTIDEAGLTTFVNGKMAQMLGLTPAQMLGRHMFEFMDDAGRSQAAHYLQRRRQGIREAHEFALRHRSGELIWTAMSTSPIEDEAGQYQGALAMVTDISDKKRAEHERELLQAQMLEAQKLDSLGLLAGGIAHDFNNLLAVILGHLEIASADTRLVPGTRNAIASAANAAQRAAVLTRQLLDYAGRGQLQERPICLADQTAELLGLVQASIPKHVRVELAVDDPTLTVVGDPDRIQHSTLNLVLNAAEAYGNAPGRVFVRVGAERVSDPRRSDVHPPEQVKPGDYVFVEVRDFGRGMDPPTLARMFEPFFTTKAAGRGLGLAACLGVVRGHGGYLTVRSELGEGTTVRAYLPRSAPQPSSCAHEAIESAVGQVERRTLLVVDDEPMIRGFARSMLELEGYGVLEAASGGEALELLRGRIAEIHGLLLDLSMPGMDGSVVLSTLRTFAPDLPVIVQTGYSAEATAQRLAQWRVKGVLQKPYRAAQLTQLVEALFSRNEAAS